MGWQAEQGVRMAALSAALRARLGEICAADVDDLATMAAALPEADTLAGAVRHFAARFDAVRWDRVALADEGRALQRAVELHALPVPPDLGRADIHG